MRSRRLLFAVLAAFSLLAVTGLVVQAATRSKEAQSSARNVKNSYQIRGAVSGDLIPGERLPVRISIANNKSYPLWITRLKISAVVDEQHRLAGCSSSRDFRFTQLGNKTFPLKIAKRQFRVVKVKSKGKVRKKKQAVFRTLSSRVAKGQPTIELVNLPDVNQDACKGATISFKFDSRAEQNLKQAKKRSGK